MKEEAVKKGQNFVYGGVDGVLDARNKRAGKAFKSKHFSVAGVKDEEEPDADVGADAPVKDAGSGKMKRKFQEKAGDFKQDGKKARK